MENEIINTLLVKYIIGEASEPEVQQVKHWMSLHPENEQYFIELYETWQNMLLLKPEIINDEKAYQKFLAKHNPKQTVSRPSLNYLRFAAGIFFVVLLSVIIFLKIQDKAPVAYQVVEAKKGTTLQLTLEDSTIVYLNSGSKLRYETSFGRKNRTVYLEGEAFFDISHNVKNMPFIVHAKNYVIRDIGTRFNLKAYPNDQVFETTVIKGEVSVEKKNDSNTLGTNRIYLKAHQTLKISPPAKKADLKESAQSQVSYNEVQVTHIDSAKLQLYDGWKDNLLAFDGITLSEIAKVLERRYDVTITIDCAELQNIKYSGSFKNVMDIDKVLHIIKQNTPFNYTIEGQNITITKTNCSR